MWSLNKTLVETKQSAGAIIRRCSVNKILWKIRQNSQENTFARVSFWWSFRHRDLQLYWKVILAKVFSCEFYKVFSNTVFCRISANSCFWISKVLGAYSPFWSPFRRRGRVYENYLRMIPECFDELFLLLDIIYTFS